MLLFLYAGLSHWLDGDFCPQQKRFCDTNETKRQQGFKAKDCI